MSTCPSASPPAAGRHRDTAPPFQATLQDRRLRRASASSSAGSAASTCSSTSAARWSAACAPSPQRRGTPDLAAYGARLKADTDELDAFLDRVTINVSHLWRHEDQWTALGHDDPARARAERRQIRCWSAGSSYGAEAFTLAAVARESVPDARVEIQGTDLDRRMVARARAGRFSAEDARTAPPALLKRWFDPVDDGGWQAKPELMRMMRFDVGDLLRMPVPDGPIRPDHVPQHRHLLHRRGPRRPARAASPTPWRPAATSSSARPSASPTRARSGLTSPFHFIYRKSQA